MNTLLKVGNRRIRLEHPDGSSVAMQDGQVVISSEQGHSTMALVHELDKELRKEGIGEWVKWLAAPAAALFGITNCSKCESTRVIGNAYRQLKAKHGMFQAISIMKSLVATSRVDPEQALLRLKEYLA